MIRKYKSIAVWLLLVCLLFAGCGAKEDQAPAAASSSVTVLPADTAEAEDGLPEASSGESGDISEADAFSSAESGTEERDGAGDAASDDRDTDGESSGQPAEEAEQAPEEEPPDAGEAESADAELTVEEDGTYTSREEVALYIHTYGRLPSNYITKKKAEKLGWDSSRGNLWDVAPGMSIGGGRFGNYEGNLPDGDYRECDIDYDGGYRGAKRIVYSDDGRIYYTEDHYKTFEQLY